MHRQRRKKTDRRKQRDRDTESSGEMYLYSQTQGDREKEKSKRTWRERRKAEKEVTRRQNSSWRTGNRRGQRRPQHRALWEEGAGLGTRQRFMISRPRFSHLYKTKPELSGSRGLPRL